MSTLDSAAVWSATSLALDETKIGAAGLSVRQRKLLALLAQPAAVPQLAERISLPIEDVRAALERLAKLGFAQSSEAVPMSPMATQLRSPTAVEAPSRAPMMIGVAVAAVAAISAAAWLLRGGSPTGASAPVATTATTATAASTAPTASQTTPTTPAPATGASDSADSRLLGAPAKSAAAAAPPPASAATANTAPTTAANAANAAAAAAAAAAASVRPVTPPLTTAPATAAAPVPVPTKAGTSAAAPPAATSPSVTPTATAPAATATPALTLATTLPTAPAGSSVAAPATGAAALPAAQGATATTEIAAATASPSASTAARTAPAAAREIKLVNRVEPAFPRGFDAEKGTVRARLQVDARGAVTSVDIVEASPPRVFDRTVRSALQQWRYEPTGEAFTVIAEINFSR